MPSYRDCSRLRTRAVLGSYGRARESEQESKVLTSGNSAVLFHSNTVNPKQ
jgi:hypothetical protein